MISVIVPVYNAEKYLRKCIESILNQTYTHLELLLINDGSTDGSGPICDEYATKDLRVKVYHKPNEGVACTRNLGLDLAHGEWITFVDADDWIETDVYERVISTLQQDEADICCYDFKIIYPNRRGYLYTPNVCDNKSDYINKWLRFALTSLCTMVVKKELFEKHHLRCPLQNYCEDFYLTVKLLFYASKITKIDYCAYNYNRINDNSLVNNINEKAAEQELAIYKEILAFFEQQKVLPLYEEAVVWRILKCTQHFILNPAKHDHFRAIFPKSYSRYIFSAPQNMANSKIKIMAWMLCHNMGWGVKIINCLRAIFRR